MSSEDPKAPLGGGGGAAAAEADPPEAAAGLGGVVGSTEDGSAGSAVESLKAPPPATDQSEKLRLTAEKLKLQAEKLRLEVEKEQLILQSQRMLEKEVMGGWEYGAVSWGGEWVGGREGETGRVVQIVRLEVLFASAGLNGNVFEKQTLMLFSVVGFAACFMESTKNGKSPVSM